MPNRCEYALPEKNRAGVIIMGKKCLDWENFNYQRPVCARILIILKNFNSLCQSHSLLTEPEPEPNQKKAYIKISQPFSSYLISIFS